MFLFQAGLLHVTERARAPGGGEVGAGVWERLRENAQERWRTGKGGGSLHDNARERWRTGDWEDCAKMRGSGGGREKRREKGGRGIWEKTRKRRLTTTAQGAIKKRKASLGRGF